MLPSLAFFGTPNFSVPILESLSNHFDISLVVSQPDKPLGKGMRLSPSPISRYALDHNLPLIRPESLKNPSVMNNIKGVKVDVAVVVAYGNILPSWMLDWPTHGAVNIHGSILPRYRGASPIAAAILNQDHKTGITLIKMNEKMDEGDTIAVTDLLIDPQDTTQSLSEKMSTLAATWTPNILECYIKGAITPVPQDHHLATYTKILSKSDGQVHLDALPQNLSAMIRAYYPWPGTWTYFRDKRVKLLPEGMVQMEGKKPTSLDDFLNGYPDFPIKKL